MPYILGLPWFQIMEPRLLQGRFHSSSRGGLASQDLALDGSWGEREHSRMKLKRRSVLLSELVSFPSHSPDGPLPARH